MLSWPLWIFEAIGPYWPALEAKQQLDAVSAAAAPHARPSDYRRFVAELEADAAVLTPITIPRAPMDVQEYDPVKAAAWFAEQGVKVVTSG